MSDDINSPRVRQILAIHAEQAAEAKAKQNLAERTILHVLEQRDKLYSLLTAQAEWLLKTAPDMGAVRGEFSARGWELHKLARGFVDNPGPCPYPHGRIAAERGDGRCPVCDEDQDTGLPF